MSRPSRATGRGACPALPSGEEFDRPQADPCRPWGQTWARPASHRARPGRRRRGAASGPRPYPGRVADFPDVRLHVVSGKGGTGKTTVAAALALALAGRRPPGAAHRGRGAAGHRAAVRRAAAAVRGAQGRRRRPAAGRSTRWRSTPRRRCWTTCTCSTGCRRPGSRPARCAGWAPSTSPRRSRRACATCCSPARSRRRSIRTRRRPARLRRRRRSTPRRPAGSRASSTSRQEVGGLAKVGPIKNQSEGVMAVLRSPQTAVHLVTLLEEMPVQETLDGVAELAVARPAGRRRGRQRRPRPAARARRPRGRRGRARWTSPRCAPGWRRPGSTRPAPSCGAGRRGGRPRRAGWRSRSAAATRSPAPHRPTYELPLLPDAVDLGGLYALAAALPTRAWHGAA